MINGWMTLTKCLSSFYVLSGLLGCFVMTLSSCSYEGGNEQPVIRKFTWFSYIAAEDIKAKCIRGSKAQYRFVYNGVYNEQVRTYDITQVESDRYNIKISVTEEADISSYPLDINNPDFFEPWKPKISVTNVSAKDIGVLRQTLKDAGYFDSLPPSGKLSSINFYWVISTCIDGKFHQNAYYWPDKKFKTAEFPNLLRIWDFTEIPINPPRSTSKLSIYGTTETKHFRNHFNLDFGRNGFLRQNFVK